MHLPLPVYIHPAMDPQTLQARLGPLTDDLLAELADVWVRWSFLLRLAAPQPGQMAIWLDAAVEAEVDAAMAAEPFRGVLLDALAGALVEGAAAALVPETAAHGCAPLPPGEASTDLAATMRRYGALTWRPWRGGCDACALAAPMGADPCPRLRRPRP